MRSETINNTKIVATLGPASWHKDVMIEMIKAGVNVFRVNFSHGPGWFPSGGGKTEGRFLDRVAW